MFLIFGGERYYASGGANDYIDCRDTINDAKAFAENLIGDRAIYERCGRNGDPDMGIGCWIEWAHIMDAKTGLIVERFGGRPYGFESQIIGITKAT